MSPHATELAVLPPPTLPDLQHPVEHHTSPDGKIDILALPSQNRTAEGPSTPYPFPDAPPPPKDLTVAVTDPIVDGLTDPAVLEAYAAPRGPDEPISTNHQLASNTFPTWSPRIERETYNCTPWPTISGTPDITSETKPATTPQPSSQCDHSSSAQSCLGKDKPLPPLPTEARSFNPNVGYLSSRPITPTFRSTLSVVSSVLAGEFGDGDHGRARGDSTGVLPLGYGERLSSAEPKCDASERLGDSMAFVDSKTLEVVFGNETQ